MNARMVTSSVVCLFGLMLLGCDRKPPRVETPAYNPTAIAEGAMKLFDTNSDGFVAGDELAKAGSLRDDPTADMKVIDKDGDGKVSQAEIQNRVQSWIDSKVGIQSVSVTVNLDGKPLEGADVTATPEPFMGGTAETASGVTGVGGVAILKIPDDKLPADQKGLSGMRSGFYTIAITHPSISIPAKFNTASTLGLEVSQEGLGSRTVTFDVKSR